MIENFDYKQFEKIENQNYDFHYRQEDMFNLDWNLIDNICTVYTSDIECQKWIIEHSIRHPGTVKFISCRRYNNNYEDWKVVVISKEFFLKRIFENKAD